MQAATGAGVFVYSRAGYGASTPGEAAAAARLHAHRGARRVAEAARSIGFRRGLLLGHSDGASIAAIYAGAHQDHRVQGVAMIAPHFIVEDISVASIAEIKTAYETTEPEGKARALAQGCRQRLLWLERRLARSEVPRLGYFRIPRLYPRAGGDPAGCGRPVWDNAAGRDRAGRVLLSGRCDGHPGRGTSPHREAPGATLDAISEFANAVLHVHDGSQGRAA